MDDSIDAFHGCRQTGRISDITRRLLIWEVREEAAAASFSQQQADAVTVAGDLLGNVRAQEAAGAGDENLHRWNLARVSGAVCLEARPLAACEEGAPKEGRHQPRSLREDAFSCALLWSALRMTGGRAR